MTLLHVAGQCNGPSGHLFVRLRVQSHRIFKRDSDDIHVDVQVPLHIALLGGQIDVPVIEGTTKIKLEPGTQPYEQRVLRGYGVKSINRNQKGNQYIHIKVQLPTKLDTHAQQLVKELAQVTGQLPAEPTTPQQPPQSTPSNDQSAQQAPAPDATDNTANKPNKSSDNTTTKQATTPDKPSKSKAKKSKSFVDRLKGFVGNECNDTAHSNKPDNEMEENGQGKIKQSN